MRRSGGRLGRLAAIVTALGLAMVAGCSRRSGTPEGRAAAPPAPDTLLDQLTPRLTDWFALWRHADPDFRPDRLRRQSQGPFTLLDIRRYEFRDRGETRRRHLFGVYAPDSERYLDPDRGLDVDAQGGPPVFTHGSDSSTALVDLRTRSVATLEPVGLRGAADGALWLGPLRFAVTGTVATDDSSGMRCGYVLAYDLRAGTVTQYRTPAVDSTQFRRFLAARESAWLAWIKGPAR